MKSAAWRNLPVILAFLLCGLAFAHAYRTTSDLQVPPEEDFYRDMGSAEAIASGDWFSDPAYRNEYRWYNPLTTAIVGFAQRLTQIPMPVLYARAGIYLNLLGPLAFFWMVSLLLDRWSALAALTCYLFFGIHGLSSWFCATYSPWLWPCNFTQAFFYSTVAVYCLALKKQRWYWDVGVGLLLGLTFLSHTAPALILAVVVAATQFWRAFRNRGQILSELRKLVVIGVVSFLVALPFLGIVIFAYGMQTRNPVPGSFNPFSIRTILGSYVTARSFVALSGLIVLFGRKQYFPEQNLQKSAKTLLAMLVAVTTFFFFYALVAQQLKFGRIVPLFHFQIYAKALEATLFGLGLSISCRYFCKFLNDAAAFRKQSDVPPLFANVNVYSQMWLLCLLAVFIIAAWQPYAGSLDFVFYRNESLRLAQKSDRNNHYRWIHANTQLNDVFLCDNQLALYSVTAAGRKVVCTFSVFSNLFVDYHQRERDRKLMFAALKQGDEKTFNETASRYAVKYVIAHDAKEACDCRLTKADRDRLEKQQFQLVFRSGPIWVYRIPQNK